MTTLPRISIVIPCYQAERYIADTLASIRQQEYPDLNLILADGGSRDRTVQIVRESGVRFDHIISEPDRGQSDAINKGMRLADGQIVSWLNADDMLTPGTLLEVARRFADDPRTKVLCGDGFFVNEDNTQVIQLVRPGKADFRWHLKYFEGCYLPQPAVFLRREVWLEAGGVDVGLRYAMDIDLWLRVSARHPIRRVERVFALTRLHMAAKTLGEYLPFQAEVRDTLLGHASRLAVWESLYWRCRIHRAYARKVSKKLLSTRLERGNPSTWAGFWQLLVSGFPCSLAGTLPMVAAQLVRSIRRRLAQG